MIARWISSLALLASSAAFPAAASGPVGIRIEAYSSYTDNLFQNYRQRSEWMTLAYVDLDYVLRPDLDLYYAGSASLFSEYGDLFNHTHRAGLTWIRTGKDRWSTAAGLNVSVRQNRSSYQYRDYLQSEGFASGKRYLESGLFRMGYRTRLREYLRMEDFSYAEQRLSARISRFFPTRTTLIAGTEIGVKTFLRSRTGSERILAQWVLHLKAAQSLLPGMGAQVEYRRRINPRNGNRYAGQDFDLDQELFDDRYSYEGSEWRGRLKYVRGRGLEVSLGAGSVRRKYEDRPVLDLQGNPIGKTREDRRNSLRIEAVRRLSLGPAYEVDLRLEWAYLDVRSNDPYYDSETQIATIGLALEF